MKYIITIISMCFSLNAGAEEVNKIINSDKINQILEVENYNNTSQEQLALNLYKQRLNLLSYKERQLKVYENSLNGMKMQLELLQIDMENKQNQINEKEIVLLKKELSLKEKENDLKQLEEKLSQIDNIQLMRNTSKMSLPSSIMIDNKNVQSNYVIEKKVRRKVKNSVNAVSIKENSQETINNTSLMPSMSGLVDMKKDNINGLNLFEPQNK